MNSDRVYKGRQRKRTTKLSVIIADYVSKYIITIGGIGTIIAVLMVCLFLLWVAFPLFLPADIQFTNTVTAEKETSQALPIRIGIDEFQQLGWSLFPNGDLHTFQLKTGTSLNQESLFENKTLTAYSFSNAKDQFILGFSDGTILPGAIVLENQFLSPDTLTQETLDLFQNNTAIPYQGGLLIRTPEEQYRWDRIQAVMQEPLTLPSENEIQLLGHIKKEHGYTIAALDSENRLFVLEAVGRQNFLTSEVTLNTNSYEVPFESPTTREKPAFLKISGLGNQIYLVWSDGNLIRFDSREFDQVQIAERVDLIPSDGVEVTQMMFLLGKTTLVVGDSEGGFTAWFPIKPENAQTPDGAVLAAAHQFEPSGSAVQSFAASSRTRMLAVGFANGLIQIYNITGETKIGEVQTGNSSAIHALKIAPKDNGLLAFSNQRMFHWLMNPQHPEASFSTIFLPVWYEGYSEPMHVWQSSSGTDEFEPKLGLMPLIFGTIKATFYSMLFGWPIAMLAALFTSEFLHPRAKAVIKPMIEMMASLPSVVLGFLAALVFAPFIEKYITTGLLSIVLIPFVILLGGHIWQLLPQRIRRLSSHWRLLFVLLTLPVAFQLTIVLGPWVERQLFAGNIKNWLDGQIGTGFGAWMMFLFPLSAIATVAFTHRFVNPFIGSLFQRRLPIQYAVLNLVKFLLCCVITLGLAWFAAQLFSGLGFDPRGMFVGTYVQRNSMVVGFVMGFAIIPIIYTIADDALSSVPEQLRSASLGCGATPWQTAIRIIIPTAMSGLFSASMIGLGRAVGETMIVLMAAGNTPIMDWNIFNGFRTLSANIAVELPEAVQNSTHYRTLFLAALTLFIMTFVINTIAEIVRIQFRKRSYQL